jgi:septal ring factor EnvC (AmiA/AmiB activator)
VKRLIYIILILILSGSSFGQTKAELEDQRKRALEEIEYVNNLIKTTAQERTETLSDLRIINSRLTLRQNVIKGLQEEINLLNDRIGLNRLAIDMMENDLELLKKEYARSVVNSYKTGKVNTNLIYVLSARDFNQGYKRMKYLQQSAKFRRMETEIINEIKEQIESSREKLEEDLERIFELKQREEQQRNILVNERGRTNKLVQNLTNKEKQLQKELEEKRRIAKRIETEIARLIEEEKKKSAVSDMTPEMKLISNNFAENKGRLPWPVERGVITTKFGIQNHPVLKYVKEDNPGINITSSGQTEVRSVFNGVVSKVFSLTGANMTVIINHGRYYTVYQNLVEVRVKQGERIETKDLIGKVFSEVNSGNRSVLTFMIYDGTVKLDPELWISKKN